VSSKMSWLGRSHCDDWNLTFFAMQPQTKTKKALAAMLTNSSLPALILWSGLLGSPALSNNHHQISSHFHQPGQFVPNWRESRSRVSWQEVQRTLHAWALKLETLSCRKALVQTKLQSSRLQGHLLHGQRCSAVMALNVVAALGLRSREMLPLLEQLEHLQRLACLSPWMRQQGCLLGYWPQQVVVVGAWVVAAAPAEPKQVPPRVLQGRGAWQLVARHGRRDRSLRGTHAASH